MTYSSDSEQIRAGEGLVTEPLAGVLVRIRIVRRLIHHLYLHFTDAQARARVIRDIKVTREWTELLELRLVYHSSLSVGHGEL